MANLHMREQVNCCSILTSHVWYGNEPCAYGNDEPYMLMVMSHEVMEISHVLMLFSHVFVCLHILMRFHYKLE